MDAKSKLVAKRPQIPELGSVQLVDLSSVVEGWVCGIKHCPPEVVRAWQFRLRASTLAERERVAAARVGKTTETHPHLFDRAETVEGAEEMVALALDVSREALEPEDHAIVERLEPALMMAVLLEVLQVQRPFRGRPAAAESAGDQGS